jgi:hypothetical protein
MKPKNGLDSYKSTLTDAEIATLFEVPVQEDFNLGFLDPASLNLNVDFTSETPKTQQSMAIAVRAASAEHPIPAASGTRSTHVYLFIYNHPLLNDHSIVNSIHRTHETRGHQTEKGHRWS